ncbi:MAG: hypothetical protein AB2715_05220 [Candidatus Thiodiazotropha sp.]
MKFFIPMEKDEERAEELYQAFARFVYAPIEDNRIWKLSWRHDGKDMKCEVGKPLPEHYRTGDEPVLAIFDCGNQFKICTENRGGFRGDPVLAENDWQSHVVYFGTV